MKRTLIGMTVLAASFNAAATTDYNKTVNNLGVQGNNAYFNVVEGFSVTCAFNEVYLDITTNSGMASYATLLSAKLSGKMLSRIDYSYGSDGQTCVLGLVSIQN